MTISYVIIVSYRIEVDNEARAPIGIEFELIWERKVGHCIVMSIYTSKYIHPV